MRTFLLSAVFALTTTLGLGAPAQAKFRVAIETAPAVENVAVKSSAATRKAKKKRYTNSNWKRSRKRKASASKARKRAVKRSRVAKRKRVAKWSKRVVKRKRVAKTRRSIRRKRVAASKRRARLRRTAALRRARASKRKRVRRVASSRVRKSTRKARRTASRRVRTRKPEGGFVYSTQRVSVAAYIGKVRRRAPGTVLRGIASFYWQPQPLASGGRFNPNALTAAHKTLPFGTRVRVKNLRNGRTVTVRINDRGPYIKGRIIDLSKRAAGVIGMQARGIAPVTVTVLGR